MDSSLVAPSLQVAFAAIAGFLIRLGWAKWETSTEKRIEAKDKVISDLKDDFVRQLADKDKQLAEANERYVREVGRNFSALDGNKLLATALDSVAQSNLLIAESHTRGVIVASETNKTNNETISTLISLQSATLALVNSTK